YLTPRAQLRDGFDGVFARVFGPLLGEIAERLGAILDRGAAASIALRLRQAGWYRGLDEHEAATRYRMRQLGSVALGGVIGLAASRLVSGSLGPTVTLAILGALIGATRPGARLQTAIDARRELMGVEIYTINQLLAMRVRVGGGVIRAEERRVGDGLLIA